jgi:hypothetical protein
VSDRAEAHRIAEDILAYQHVRAARTVQALAPLAREFLLMTANEEILQSSGLDPRAPSGLRESGPHG